MTYINAGNRLIVAISGKQLSGKDFLTKILLSKCTDFKRVGLGDAIKMELAKQKNISIEEIEQNKHIYRPELIELGNQGRELDDGLYWIKKILSMSGNIIVPDIRVKKEFFALKEKGAIMIRVECDRTIRMSRGMLVKEDDVTECNLDDITIWDYIIFNNSDESNLRIEAQKIIDLINIKRHILSLN